MRRSTKELAWSLNWSYKPLHYLIWYAWHIVHVVYLSRQRFPAVRACSGPCPLSFILALAMTIAGEGCFKLSAELSWGRLVNQEKLLNWTQHHFSVSIKFWYTSYLFHFFVTEPHTYIHIYMSDEEFSSVFVSLFPNSTLEGSNKRMV